MDYMYALTLTYSNIYICCLWFGTTLAGTNMGARSLLHYILEPAKLWVLCTALLYSGFFWFYIHGQQFYGCHSSWITAT